MKNIIHNKNIIINDELKCNFFIKTVNIKVHWSYMYFSELIPLLSAKLILKYGKRYGPGREWPNIQFGVLVFMDKIIGIFFFLLSLL